MMTLAGVAVLYTFGAAVIGRNGHAALGFLATIALVLMKCAP